MKIYHEIYPSEAWAEKISKYLTTIAEEKPHMYAKTRKRYEQLAHSLLNSVSLIASILEEDLLVPTGTDEFNDLAEPATGKALISEMVAELNHKLKKAEEFSQTAITRQVAASPPLGSFSNSFEVLDPHVSQLIHAGSSPPLDRTIEEILQPSYQHDSPYFNHDEICSYYDTIFEEASSTNFGYMEVNECAKMLYQWFHTRFMKGPHNSKFVCQIRYLPTWIMNFILLYGKYVQDDRTYQFKVMVDNWCSRVQQGKIGNYAVPFDVYRLEKDVKDHAEIPSDYTIEAVVINDLLANMCLYKLGDGEYEGPVRYNSSDLAQVVRNRNPATLTKIRTRFVKRQELIDEIGLTPSGGGDIDG